MRLQAISIMTFFMSLSCASSGSYFKSSAETGRRIHTAPVIEDTVELMSLYFPPAKTTLAVDSKQESDFGKRLIASLRSAGYALDSVKKGSRLTFAYKLQEFDDNHYALRIVAGEGFQASRMYQKKSSSLVASSAFTIRRNEVE